MGESSRTEKRISKFIESFGKKLDWKSASGYFPERRIFYDHHEEPNNVVVEHQIISAFSDVVVPRLPGLLQFWSLRQTDNGIRFLSSSDQPFALEDFDPRHHFYRYTPDNKDFWTIENSPVATAFLNGFPDVVFDLRSVRRRNSPLVEAALSCGFTSLILLPVFDHNSSCVSVVEFSMKASHLFILLQELRSALERAGLSTYHVQASLPFETIPGLRLATHEIEVALKTLCESHQLSLAQVWIANDSEKHAPCSSSWQVTQTKQKKLAVKLSGYCTGSLDDHPPVPHINLYYETCNVLPLKMREVSIVRKTLETNQPHFCRSLNELMVNGPLGFLLSLCKCSCLAICLRSTHTGDNVDYVFEFLWPRGRNYSIVLESLLLNLKRCLPSFKFVSGQQRGGELRVVVFQNSTASGVGSFEVLKPEQGKVKEEDDHKQHQGAMKGAAMNLYGQGPNSLKRKLTGLSKGSYILYTDPFWNVDDDIPVSTSYLKKTATVTIRSSYILIDAMEKIEEEFMLKPKTYTLEYQAEGNWFKLETNLHLAGLRKCYRKDPNCRLKVCVLPSRIGTNGLADQQHAQ